MQCRLLENARCLKGRWDFTANPGNGICQNLSMGFVLFCFLLCFFFCFYMYVGNLGNHLFKWQM